MSRRGGDCESCSKVGKLRMLVPIGTLAGGAFGMVCPLCDTAPADQVRGDAWRPGPPNLPVTSRLPK